MYLILEINLLVYSISYYDGVTKCVIIVIIVIYAALVFLYSSMCFYETVNNTFIKLLRFTCRKQVISLHIMTQYILLDVRKLISQVATVFYVHTSTYYHTIWSASSFGLRSHN